MGGAALALFATGDRTVFSVPVADQGIDPLDVLSTKTRPNVYLVIDSSASMAQFTDYSTVSATKETGTEDEPNAKMAQAKAVLKQLVAANQGVANFAIARYKGTATASLPSTDRFQYSTDTVDFPSMTTATAQFDLRQFKLAAGLPIIFTENGTARTSANVPAGNYNTGWDLAAAVETALNGTASKTNTYKVSFTDPPNGTDARFAIQATNVSPVTFTIKSTTNATLRATLGLGASDLTPAAVTLTLNPPSNGSTYNLGAADAFSFTEGGVARTTTVALGNYNTTTKVATALQTALNATASKTNTYSVTYTASKYRITTTNASPVTFCIDGSTFAPAAWRTALGFAAAVACSNSPAYTVVTAAEPSGAEVAETAHRDSSLTGSGVGRTGVAGTVANWLLATKFFSDMTLRIGPDGTPCSISPSASPSADSAAISVQSMSSCDPAASPTTVGSPTTFTLAGANWAGASSSSCGGLDPLVGMGACTNLSAQIDDIGPYLEPGIRVTDVDAGAGVTPGIVGFSQDFLGNATYTTGATIPEQKGIRMNAATPIAESLIALYKEFNALWNSSVSAQPVGRRQKNYVIFLTDGDDTCETVDSSAAGLSASNLSQHALRAAYDAQILYQGVKGNPVAAASGVSGGRLFAWPPPPSTDAESRVTTFVVVFGNAAGVGNANAIAWAGTGMTQSTLTGSSFGTRWTTMPTSKGTCTTCRDAFTASNAEELSAALQSAVNLTLTGEFSDQQSITETVYEYVKLAPTPAPTVPPTPTPVPQDPMNALSRYARTVPVLIQSTFVMPGFEGHLTAFRNSGGTGVPLWDAGDKLRDRVVNGVDGTDGMLSGEYNFAALRGNGTMTTIRTSTAKIKRRIFSTRSNGRLTSAEYSPQNLVDQSALLGGPSGGFEQVALWPPSAAVSPSDAANSTGILDAALGLASAADVPGVQALVPDACKGATAGDCVGSTAVRLAKARREAREILLAWIAGATPARAGGNPKRVANEIVYVARTWVMAESTLASPAVAAPPPQAESTEFKRDEYLLYRDGPRKGTGSGTDPCPPSTALQSANCFSVNAVSSGFGLRNPDLDGSSVDGSFTAQNNAALKPVMSVVYHATNSGLHAFRAGPCPKTTAYSPIGNAMTIGCASGTVETGGEELWAFIPFDQLGKIRLLLSPQANDASKVYMLAAPVRFSDVWIDGGWSRTLGSNPYKNVSGTGVWRTLAFFGRGAGGKFMTGLDVTTAGVIGTHSLDTMLPVVMWNRGNPDAYNPSGFAKFGETWSVPAVSRVVAADYDSNDHVLFMGGGYSSNPAEGSTFFVLSPRTGDIIKSFTIPDGVTTAPNPPFRNKLVAGPTVFSELSDGRSPLDQTFLGNPAGALTTSVFFPDLHGRIWKYSTATPNNSPVIFANPRADDGVDHPIANSVSLLRYYPTPLPSPVTSPVPPPTLHVYAESGNDNRVALRSSGTPFRMFAYRDTGSYPVAPIFTRNFASTYRGQVQPATAFVTGEKPVVFFAGNEFSTANEGCISQFNAILFALSAATGSAAFDLNSNVLSNDESIVMTAQRVNAIRAAGSRLVVDTGLNAQIAPPPPDVPTTGQTSTVGSSVATVTVGGDPSNVAHANFRTTNIPFRMGTASCKAGQ